MKKAKIKKKKTKGMALFQIFLMITFSFAVAFITSESVVVVRGQIDVSGIEISPLPPIPGETAVGGGITLSGSEIWANAPKGAPEPTGFITKGLSKLPEGIGGTASKFIAPLAYGVAYAAIGYGVALAITAVFGLDNDISKALGTAFAAGGAVAGIIQGLHVSGFISHGFITSLGGLTLVGLGIAVVIFVFTYKKTKYEEVTFNCKPWEAPIGGSKCEECNKDVLRPCSEYRCKSLGQACELINVGTEQEICVHISPNDVKAPVIKPLADSLKPRGLKYTNYRPSPPNRGVEIVNPVNEGGCLKAYTPLEFGISLDEPGHCKIDLNHTDSFEDMQYDFGENSYRLYNHTQKLKLPKANASTGQFDSPVITTDGIMNLYVRCMDANGNGKDMAEFAISFCVDPAPDTTPPLIEGSSILDGSPVRAGVDSLSIDIYVNEHEPPECRWSRQDKGYENMENEMSCPADPVEMNANLQYVCSGNLTGIKDLAENQFFFRCRDSAENTMVQSYELTLIGSQPLNIIKVLPNETVTGSTLVVPVNLEVETDDGASEGVATCLFSDSGDTGTYTLMFETNSHLHKQNLQLQAGSYNYHFTCVDAGGNSAEDEVEFEIFVDKDAPIVTRAYKEEPDALKIVTNEDAECVYSPESCNYVFDEGLAMINNPPTNKRAHFVSWDTTKGYYIKCRDDFGNVPSPNACSIIARASQIS